MKIQLRSIIFLVAFQCRLIAILSEYNLKLKVLLRSELEERGSMADQSSLQAHKSMSVCSSTVFLQPFGNAPWSHNSHLQLEPLELRTSMTWHMLRAIRGRSALRHFISVQAVVHPWTCTRTLSFLFPVYEGLRRAPSLTYRQREVRLAWPSRKGFSFSADHSPFSCVPKTHSDQWMYSGSCLDKTCRSSCRTSTKPPDYLLPSALRLSSFHIPLRTLRR